MNFWDIPPEALPPGSDYYFGVCLLEIAAPIGTLADTFDIWYLDEVQEPRPCVVHIYEDEVEDYDYAVYADVVIEVWNNEVSWYATWDEEEEEEYYGDLY